MPLIALTDYVTLITYNVYKRTAKASLCVPQTSMHVGETVIELDETTYTIRFYDPLTKVAFALGGEVYAAHHTA